jgi:hypothetical protein
MAGGSSPGKMPGFYKPAHRENKTMKATGKNIGRLIVGCAFACCLSLFTLQAFTIEGLKISVQSSNAVLSWPSASNETYIAQYRKTLDANSSWVTLTNYLPAATNATTTIFSNSPGSTNRTGFYRVVRDGAHLFGITNGMVLSGEVKVLIEFAVDSTDEIAGVTFYANGSPLIGASASANAGGGWILDWNTRMMPNGNCDITAEIDFNTDAPVTSVPITITVNNTISFPNYFTRVFGYQMWIYAETIPNAAYEIDMYDENTNYFGSFLDYADGNGIISFLWDLTDGNGHTFDSTNFYGVFAVDTSSPNIVKANRKSFQMTNAGSPAFGKIAQKASSRGRVHPNAGGSSSSASQTWALEWNWSGYDNFVIACAPLNNFGTTTDKINLMVAEGVVDILWNGYTINFENKPLADTAFVIYGAGDKNTLMGHLGDPSYRNFYFFGHGSPYAIGGVGAGTVTTYSEIAHALNNFFITTKPANYHPYRFVFIDGCSAGQAAFCEAFGILAQTLNNAFFANAGVRSRAFIGLKTDTGFNPEQWQQRANMLANFWTEWKIYGYDVRNCVNDAVNFGSGGLDSSAVIYGAANLTINTP